MPRQPDQPAPPGARSGRPRRLRRTTGRRRCWFGERRWRVRGLDRAAGGETLKLNLMAAAGGRRVSTSTRWTSTRPGARGVRRGRRRRSWSAGGRLKPDLGKVLLAGGGSCRSTRSRRRRRRAGATGRAVDEPDDARGGAGVPARAGPDGPHRRGLRGAAAWSARRPTS